MANITFNSVDLSAQGLVTSEANGLHTLAPMELRRVMRPGTPVPSDIKLYRSLVTLTFKCVTVATTHANLVTALNTLKGYLSPELGWKYLLSTDVSSKRTLARCLGFPVNIDALPYDTDCVEYDLAFERLPFWEDSSAQTATNPSSVNNDGQLPCYPVYTCTCTAACGSGIKFTVNGKSFTYSSALAINDVVVVDAEACTVTKNAANAISGVLSTTEFPELATGSNTCTKDVGTFTWAWSYRRRYE